ncbi:c-type cytochrome [Stieleria varia]|uniref:Cytochrome c n=1 Tax=Stieleria varia TaxID=2528005 RepID=A0A5C6A510_9BACT|nr:c-type cytochrome [Stieleria varia]TWT94559.1 Cytochrome c [Stieleria varia]
MKNRFSRLTMHLSPQALFLRIAVVVAWMLYLAVDGKCFSADATEPTDIQVPDGFAVDLVYSVPLDSFGSWVCMTEDPKGRLICSDQRGGLYRVKLTGSDAPGVEPIDLDIGHAQGLQCVGDQLYVVVSGPIADGPGLYRVRDTDNNDQYDSVELLQSFELTNSSTNFRSVKLRLQNMLISSGHGPHGIRLGPDGMLYVMGGNHTHLPENVSKDSPYRNYAEDILLPRVDDAQGIATGIMAPGGWVLKTDLDGKEWTLVAGGLRNAYDLAFNADGELFTFDSDMEFDKGAAWYRPCRVSHLVPGGEYGWRYGSAKWPDHYTDSIGPVVDVGFGSPTGVEFGHGASFPSRYRNALFAADWAYGRIYAMSLSPDGATYRGSFETFIQGKPLPVVDLIVHSDGEMYFLTGGRNTQSGIYRVRYTGDEEVGLTESDADHNSATLRDLRRQLESIPGDGTTDSIETVFVHLNHDDRMIRYAARLALERQPLDKWHQRAMDETRGTAKLQAIVALARCGDASMKQALITQLNEISFANLSQVQTGELLRAYSLVLSRMSTDGETDDATAMRLAAEFPSPHGWAINRELCRLLVRLQSPAVIDPALELMANAGSQEEQFFYAFALRSLRSGWTIQQRKAYFTWLRMAYDRYEGGESFQGFFKQTIADAIRTLSSEEKKSIAGIISGREKPKSISKIQAPRSFVHNWQLSDLSPLMDQVSAGRSFERGREAYESTQCQLCHRMRGTGASTGPDLTGAGNRFTPDYLLEAIISPSKVIPEQYQSVKILTDDGELFTGRVVGETDASVILRTQPFTQQTVEIAVDSIAQRKQSTVSEMPEGLINTLTSAEILDLIAYIRAGGDSSDPAFQSNATK